MEKGVVVFYEVNVSIMVIYLDMVEFILYYDMCVGGWKFVIDVSDVFKV